MMKCQRMQQNATMSTQQEENVKSVQEEAGRRDLSQEAQREGWGVWVFERMIPATWNTMPPLSPSQPTTNPTKWGWGWDTPLVAANGLHACHTTEGGWGGGYHATPLGNGQVGDGGGSSWGSHSLWEGEGGNWVSYCW